MDKKTRTALQNRSLHLYYKLLASGLNEKHFDVMKTLRHDIPIPWTDSLVKELLWRKVQHAMTDKYSTTKLDSGEVGIIYETINRHIITLTDGEVIVPFPDRFGG